MKGGRKIARMKESKRMKERRESEWEESVN